MPRVVHLSSTDIRGGAARGAYWLHRALIDAGVDSRMLVDRKLTSDATVIAPANGVAVVRRLRALAERLPLAFYRPTGESFWSTNNVPSRMDRAVRRLAPDIVHVHWGGGGFLPVEAVARFGCPVVWTLRDMWPFTGGCHYTGGCDGFRTGCGRCPQLRSDGARDLSRRIFDRKRNAWADVAIWPVAISTWLATQARTSPLLANRPIEMIPNGLDVARFRPVDSCLARIEWGLPADRPVILFGALNALEDARKGFAQLSAAMSHMATAAGTRPPLLVVFGAGGNDAREIPCAETRWVGHLHDDRRLATLYAAADVMVAPSLQEAFGKTLIEAMACGTPVVAFGHGGPADIVAHRETGYLARPFDPQDLAAGIAWCLADGGGRAVDLGRAARARVETCYDVRVVARRYADLYRRVMATPMQRAA